jgi:hypothetical protein
LFLCVWFFWGWFFFFHLGFDARLVGGGRDGERGVYWGVGLCCVVREVHWHAEGCMACCCRSFLLQEVAVREHPLWLTVIYRVTH